MQSQSHPEIDGACNPLVKRLLRLFTTLPKWELRPSHESHAFQAEPPLPFLKAPSKTLSSAPLSPNPSIACPPQKQCPPQPPPAPIMDGLMQRTQSPGDERLRGSRHYAGALAGVLSALDWTPGSDTAGGPGRSCLLGHGQSRPPESDP